VTTTAVQQTSSVVVDNVISLFLTLRRLKFGSRKVVNLIIQLLLGLSSAGGTGKRERAR